MNDVLVTLDPVLVVWPAAWSNANTFTQPVQEAVPPSPLVSVRSRAVVAADELTDTEAVTWVELLNVTLLTVTPVPEPVGVLAACAAAAGLAGAVRRVRRARAAGPTPPSPSV